MSNLSKFAASQFYIHSSNTRFYYKIYQYIENWITQNIFREDSSRVFLASNEYAFRRRFELTDMSRDYKEMEASALRFPFANYWPLNSGWEPDTRVAANPANALYQGIFVGDTQVKISMVTSSIPITFYFDREDDARMAFDMLSFYTFNEHYGNIDIIYASSKLESPVSLRISDLKFNPQFKESDWLKQNRIFTITASFNIRTYMFYPPKQPNYEYNLGTGNQLYDSNGNPVYDDEGNILKYDDGSVIFPISEEVILNFQPNVILLSSMGQVVKDISPKDSVIKESFDNNSEQYFYPDDDINKFSGVFLYEKIKDIESINNDSFKNLFIEFLKGTGKYKLYNDFLKKCSGAHWEPYINDYGEILINFYKEDDTIICTYEDKYYTLSSLWITSEKFKYTDRNIRVVPKFKNSNFECENLCVLIYDKGRINEQEKTIIIEPSMSFAIKDSLMEDKLNHVKVSYRDLYKESFEDPHIYIDMFTAVPCKDYKSARITWILNDESQMDRVELNINYGASLKNYKKEDAIKVDNIEDSKEEFCYEVLQDTRIKYSILLDDLQPESLYSVDFTLFNSIGGYKKIYVGFTTEKNITEVLPENKVAPANALVGIKW